MNATQVVLFSQLVKGLEDLNLSMHNTISDPLEVLISLRDLLDQYEQTI